MTVSVGKQHWRQLLFLHWEVPASALRTLVPDALELDTFDGRAYVGAIPFLVRGARMRFLPAVPGVSDFYEVNVRTYVRYAGGDPGVWFFSLDASSTGAVLAARAGWQLPYYPSRASLRYDGGDVHYMSERQAPGPTPGRLDVTYRVGERRGAAEPGTLEHFFVERYLLYTRWRPAGLLVGPVQHQPYPLRDVTLRHLACASLVESLGVPGPTGDVHALYSPGVDVDVMSLRWPRAGANQTSREAAGAAGVRGPAGLDPTGDER
jgi:uncharacterized protein YqjF (DUF2071 family)